MTTLRQEAELIIRPLSGGDTPNDSPYDIDFVMREYKDAMREDFKRETYERRHGDGDDKSPITQYIVTYKQAVEVDEVTKRNFAAIPDYYVSLKYNKGIHSVSASKPEAKHLLIHMLRVSNPNVSAHLPVGNATGVQMYYVEGMKIFFTRQVLNDQIKNVIIKLIIPGPDSLGPDDTLPLIPEDASRIRDRVRQIIQNKAPQDRIADGNPNLRAVNEQPR